MNQLPFFGQAAVLVLDMFFNIDLVKNHKIAHNSTASEAKEK
jgi:hypothetical protein